MKAWLQLFRAPNLFTVPGDTLAGFLLATHGLSKPTLLGMVMFASLLFYAYGLVLNDLVDLAEDTAERPSRPLPSGRVRLGDAQKIAAVFCIVGFTCCAFADEGRLVVCTAAALLLAITLYNFLSKKHRLLSPVNMGLCRGLDVLLGASLAHAFNVPAIIGAVVITIYITAVSILARTETKNPAIPPLIGKLIRGLIFLQALLCALSGSGLTGWACALILALALWPLSSLIGKRFYSS